MSKYSFYGSSCTKDCSGHASGYLWAKRNPGTKSKSKSRSFNNGVKIRERDVANGRNPIGIMARDKSTGKFTKIRKG